MKLKRKSWSKICLQICHSVSERSSCKRLHVGCIITDTKHRTILGIGYNGNARGLKNCCDDYQAQGACGCIHAEVNAALKCGVAQEHIKKHVYVTHLPCLNCAKTLINLGGVKKVFYANEYRKSKSKSILNKAKIKLIKG